MRQSHAGGDELFVDYAGDTVPVIIGLSGKTRPAQMRGNELVWGFSCQVVVLGFAESSLFGGVSR